MGALEDSWSRGQAVRRLDTAHAATGPNALGGAAGVVSAQLRALSQCGQ